MSLSGSLDPTDRGAPDVPSSSSSRPTWEALQASRPMKMRFRLLPSVLALPSAAAAAAVRRRRREGGGGVGAGIEEAGGVDARVELTAAFELQLPASGTQDEGSPTPQATSSSTSPLSPSLSTSSSNLRILRLLSPTLTRDVLSSSAGSQPLINLDALLLSLGFSPLHGLLRLNLSRFRGDFELDLPRSGAASGAGEEWKRGIWVSLRTARRAIKELCGGADRGAGPGSGGAEEALRYFGAFLAWGSREAWSLDEGEEEGRMSHNWIPSPTALQPSSSLSTSSLLATSISSLMLLPRSNATVATFLSHSQRQELLHEHTERGTSREGERERVRTRLRRWTVDLLEAVEVWREDWPEDDQGDTQRHGQEQATALAKTVTSRRLLGAVPSEAKEWREATLSQLLPVLSSLEEGIRGSDSSSSSGSSSAAPQPSGVPPHLQPFLPKNLPEELLVQLQLVEYLWTISETLHSHIGSPREGTVSNRIGQADPSEANTKQVQLSSAVLRPASPTSSSPTAVSPAPGYVPGSADKTQLDPRPQRGAQLGGRIGSHKDIPDVHNESLIRYSQQDSSMPYSHTPPDGSLFSMKLGFLGNWIRFTFVIGPDPEKRDKGNSGAGGGAGAKARKGETARRTQGYRTGAAEWTSESALSWVLGALLVAVIALVVGLIVPALGSSAESRAVVA